ncbi:MAG: hypothetical protein AB7G36_18815 [Candidatus Nanopelagicales bacterium]
MSGKEIAGLAVLGLTGGLALWTWQATKDGGDAGALSDALQDALKTLDGTVKSLITPTTDAKADTPGVTNPGGTPGAITAYVPGVTPTSAVTQSGLTVGQVLEAAATPPEQGVISKVVNVVQGVIYQPVQTDKGVTFAGSDGKSWQLINGQWAQV